MASKNYCLKINIQSLGCCHCPYSQLFAVILMTALATCSSCWQSLWPRNTLFTVNFSYLHYNVFERGCEAHLGNSPFHSYLFSFALECFERGCEAISGRNYKIARNCLTSTFKNIVMQMTKGNCEKGDFAVSAQKWPHIHVQKSCNTNEKS